MTNDVANLHAAKAAEAANKAASALNEMRTLLDEAHELRQKIALLTATVLNAHKQLQAFNERQAALATMPTMRVVARGHPFPPDGGLSFFSEEYDAVMTWWDIDPVGPGSSWAIRQETAKPTVPRFQGYASTELGTILWLPYAAPGVNTSAFMKGLLPASRTFSIASNPALAALLAYCGMLVPSGKNAYVVRFPSEPAHGFAPYIVAR